ncbi:suhB [Wigglesworthia glossinidia endosymbiont of Glossina brevipalpis]|uniref:Inositol-1-monophosphatase n=1 Tax=Wigglesworthia glossinidia brevipalpis TaxID=36870 RepID=Q8D2R9_WIGBR|nr:suhB [Wigglesworthia glossinidia endosymbiont of Glossina brevipalpis]
MYPMLNIAIQAAREAGKLINKYYGGIYLSENIYQINENSFDINNAVENLICNIIKKYYPNHIILNINKEIKYNFFSRKKKEISNVKWIIDPINGYENFSTNIPHFAVSIAVQINLKTEISVIYDPIKNELFNAIRGRGAQLNGYRIRTKKIKNIKDIIISTIISNEKQNINNNYDFILNNLILYFKNFRCTGSIALDLAYVASNRFSLFFLIKSDLEKFFISNDLIIRESGGLITDFTGGHDYLYSGNILAGNPDIVKKILLIIRKKLK